MLTNKIQTVDEVFDNMLKFGNTRREIVKRAKEIIQDKEKEFDLYIKKAQAEWLEERGRMAKLLNEFEVVSW